MHFGFYYAVAVAIWGTTWYAVRLQKGVVAAELSVALRFLAASLILMIYATARGRSLTFDRKTHRHLCLQGLFLFSINYIPHYYATHYVPSGLVAAVFSLVAGFNLINSRIFLKTPIQAHLLIAVICGSLGVALLFTQEICQFNFSSQGLWGLSLAVIGTFFASFGNLFAAHTRKLKMPVTQSNAWAMGYGGMWTLLFFLLKGGDFTLTKDPVYWGAFLYLVVFGSILAFGAYVKLLGLVGPTKAAYTTVLFPVVALALSTWLEDYHWELANSFGLVMILLGNVMLLKRRKPKESPT